MTRFNLPETARSDPWELNLICSYQDHKPSMFECPFPLVDWSPSFARQSKPVGGHSASAYSGDYNELVYLRSRMYDPQIARFTAKDTWQGDYNKPLSLNRWIYVEANPVNYTDPTGECSYLPADNINIIEKYAGSFLSKNNWLDAYTAAGIAVQCWAEVLHDEGDYDGRGPAQVTNAQTYTPWGVAIPDPDGGDPRGYGLLCYILRIHIPQAGINMPCTVCENEDYMNQHYGVGNYQREDPHDQYEWRWAVEYMRRTIKLVLDVCERDRRCLNTDKYIAAALSQNGPGFNVVNMRDIPKLKESLQTPDYRLNWIQFFKDDTSLLRKNTQMQLTRFQSAIEALMYKGWTVPARDTNYIHRLMRGEYE